MSHPMREDSFESRTQLIGKKRSSANSSNSSRRKKRRRNGATSDTQGSSKPHNAFAALSDSIESTKLPQKDSVNYLDERVSSLSNKSMSNTMSDANLGRNRLAMGFVQPKRSRQDSDESAHMKGVTSARNAVGKSSASPIEISDDDMQDSEGGMVINVDQDDSPTQVYSSGESESEESGEIVSTPKSLSGSQKEATDLFIVDPTPSKPTKRLVDLDAEELEIQLRYAFFYLPRNQIDLSRPVVCLTCTAEGHLHHDCDDVGNGLFPKPKFDETTSIKLWISCCVCASKSHLVGDCPEISADQASRWSLRALNSQHIVNLSLETGTKKLEQEAENRGILPDGLKIRGRADLHTAGVPQAENSSEDEPFLRKPVAKGGPSHRGGPARHQRFDRYDPPQNQQSYRGGGQWYATDSFGRRRSRSPEEQWDSYRPRDHHDRSNVSPVRDSWRPPPPNDRRDNYRAGPQSPPRSRNAPPITQTGSNVQFSLPTRKGSNNWSQNQSGQSTPSSTGGPGNNKSKTSRRRRGGKDRRGAKS